MTNETQIKLSNCPTDVPICPGLAAETVQEGEFVQLLRDPVQEMLSDVFRCLRIDKVLFHFSLQPARLQTFNQAFQFFTANCPKSQQDLAHKQLLGAHFKTELRENKAVEIAAANALKESPRLRYSAVALGICSPHGKAPSGSALFMNLLPTPGGQVFAVNKNWLLIDLSWSNKGREQKILRLQVGEKRLRTEKRLFFGCSHIFQSEIFRILEASFKIFLLLYRTYTHVVDDWTAVVELMQ